VLTVFGLSILGALAMVGLPAVLLVILID